MSNITDRPPRRIPEWLSLQDISRAWSEETGADAAAFEADFRAWFEDFLQRNAYGEEDAGIPARLLEGRQIWRETFETFCEERGLTKPRFWFSEGDRAAVVPQPAASEPAASEPVAIAEATMPPSQLDEAPSRRRVREGGTSFTWIAAGLVVVVVAGLVTLWLRDMNTPMGDAGLMIEAGAQARMSVVAPAQPALAQAASAQASSAQSASVPSTSAQPAPAQPAPAPPTPGDLIPAVASDPAATPAPTTISDPAAAQIAAAPSMAKRTEPGVTPPLEAGAAGAAGGQLVAGEPVDQGLVLLLQRELLAAGYDPGPLDGIPGTRFATAIAGYQRANKLHADGRASIGLLSHLAQENLKAGRMAPLAPAAGSAALAPATGSGAGRGQTASRDPGTTPQTRAPVRVPAPGGRELVRAIQKRLSDRGYYDGPLDGSLGPKTRGAIETYQRVQRYDATGQPSRAIYEELEDYALKIRGLDQFKKGAFDAAVATYSKIIQRQPKNADAYFNRGLAYKNVGRTEQALTDYEAAITLDPAHRRAYFDRANILYDQGLYRDALGAYFKALKLLFSTS